MENNNRYLQLMDAIEKVIERLEENVLKYESELKEKDEQLREIRMATYPLDDNVGAQKKIVALLKNAQDIKAKAKKKMLKLGLTFIGIVTGAGLVGILQSGNPLVALALTLVVNGSIGLIMSDYYNKKISDISTLENLYSLESAERELALLENLRNEKYKEFEVCRHEKETIKVKQAHTKKDIEKYRSDYANVYERMNFVNNLVNGNVEGINMAFMRDTDSLEVVKRVRTDAKENNIV